MKSNLISLYPIQKREGNVKWFVANIFDGRIPAGGLVDRLRGIVSTFSISQQMERSYKLLFTHPFPLSDYLQPARYNWVVSEQELCFDPEETAIVVSQTLADSPSERRQQEKQLRQKIALHRGQQIHVYTNAAFSYDDDFASNFSQLFKPVPRLKEAIDKTYRQLGDGYIAVSARFRNLLDDFNEENYSEPLEPTDRQQLLNACSVQLQKLHNRYPDVNILVCSDSSTFLHEANRYDFQSFQSREDSRRACRRWSES